MDGAFSHHEEAGGADGAALTAGLTGAEAAVLLRATGPTGLQGAPHLVVQVNTVSGSTLTAGRH